MLSEGHPSRVHALTLSIWCLAVLEGSQVVALCIIWETTILGLQHIK